MEEKSVREKSGPRHSIWSNYCAVFSWMREYEGVRYFPLQGMHVVLAVAQPFFAMALPGAVVYLLGSGWEPERIFFALAGYVLALQGMHVAFQYLEEDCKNRQMIFRVKLGTQYFGASMDVDYQALESQAGQKKLEEASVNIYHGNNRGVEAFLDALGNFLINLAGLILYCVVIGRQSLGILALSLLVTGAAVGFHGYGHKRAKKYDEKFDEVWLDYNNLGDKLMQPVCGKDIRLYRMWNWFAGEFARLKEEFAYWGDKWWKWNKEYTGAAEKGLAFVRDLLVYGYLIRQMMLGRMELGAFLVYVGVAAGFSGWMTPLLDAFTAMLENNRHVDNYRSFLEFAEMGRGRTMGEMAKPQPIARAGRTHEIRLEHVSFRYEENREDTIRDLSLTIASGEKVALVGMNGAGKTTLTKLLCGLCRPTSGRIYLDGQDIAAFSAEEYYKEFAVVFQDVFAFSFRLGDNVTCKDRASADEERLRLSLRNAELWEKVQTLEQKEWTYMNRDIDPSGVQLSGGELQKLMLARALYKDAPVLILDEPTAALDPIAESSLYEKYYEMTREKTSIFISHRLSSTKFCDRIFFIEDGRITEEGSHEELLARKGAYAAMFRTQAQYYQDKEEGWK